VDKEKNTRATAYYAGSGLVVGVAIGAIFGLMLFENLAMGSAIGAAMGLLVGAALDEQQRRQAEQSGRKK